jgi:hypothetical protein
MIEKRKRALVEAARRFMEPGEEVREVMIGQSFVTPYVYLLVGPIVFVFVAQPRIVMATDRHVYVFEGNMWKAKELKSVLEKHAIGSVPMKLTGLSLTIGNEKSYAMLGQGKSMKQIASIAEGGAAQPALAGAQPA